MWLKDDKLLSIGFGKTSDRQFGVHDPRNNSAPIMITNVDNSAGMLMPFYDVDTGIVFLAGKGDGNIRYYEYVAGDEKPMYYLTEYKSQSPTMGMASVPKAALAINECEIARLLKVEQNKVTPISMIVPRKSDLFQDDIFPDTSSGAGVAALTCAEWVSGQNKDPVTVSLKDGFVVKPKGEEMKFEKKEEDTGPKSETELRKAYAEAVNRITYLEAELHKRDMKIKELTSS